MPTQRLEEKRVEESEGEGERERERERERKSAHTQERERESTLAPPFICFFLPWACPMQIGLNQECCLFYLKFSLWSSDLPLTFLCSIFAGFSLPCLLATAILDSFPLFYLPNKTMAQDGCPTSVIRLAFQSTERRECWGKGCMPTVPRRCDIIF